MFRMDYAEAKIVIYAGGGGDSTHVLKNSIEFHAINDAEQAKRDHTFEYDKQTSHQVCVLSKTIARPNQSKELAYARSTQIDRARISNTYKSHKHSEKRREKRKQIIIFRRPLGTSARAHTHIVDALAVANTYVIITMMGRLAG